MDLKKFSASSAGTVASNCLLSRWRIKKAALLLCFQFKLLWFNIGFRFQCTSPSWLNLPTDPQLVDQRLHPMKTNKKNVFFLAYLCNEISMTCFHFLLFFKCFCHIEVLLEGTYILLYLTWLMSRTGLIGLHYCICPNVNQSCRSV